jgi:hypothetical protein
MCISTVPGRSLHCVQGAGAVGAERAEPLGFENHAMRASSRLSVLIIPQTVEQSRQPSRCLPENRCQDPEARERETRDAHRQPELIDQDRSALSVQVTLPSRGAEGEAVPGIEQKIQRERPAHPVTFCAPTTFHEQWQEAAQLAIETDCPVRAPRGDRDKEQVKRK